jgi:hypothetical protein
MVWSGELDGVDVPAGIVAMLSGWRPLS